MSEFDEQRVVQKDAVVREEVMVRKRADERMEQVRDDVRRTEVEIDKSDTAWARNPRAPQDRPRAPR
jgi:stress response protein YsnF